MSAWIWIACGGALGATLRFALGSLIGLGANGFPWHTLTVNVIGCCLIGWVWGMWSEAHWFVQWGRYFLVVGTLGGFTTFSAFSLEVLMLLETQRLGLAAALVLSSVTLCLWAVWAGQQLAQLTST